MVFSVTKINFRIQAYLSTILTIFNFFYLQKYYRLSHNHSSSEIKQRLNAYLIVLAVSDIVYMVSFYFMCFIDIKQHPIYQGVFSILFFLTHPFIHLIPKGIVRLRHVNRSLYGYSLINTAILLTIIGSPILIYARFFNKKDSISWVVSGALFTFAYLLNGLSFIFDAITVLGHRFIRFYLYFPQEKAKHTRRVVVV
ncbi:hypothetical protein TVAGG3_0981810 [Trichomonas vaginalis G3]|uniref:hypothetical protein n=1 Tax=Trichomonas vaginalis (strain ATCC PRA-98 / G3) TaxID=412133 RepID=UPI0021E55372|nr:hypothetical protein TVAGG3_0981810 [Trichomonas vaginalis G3]KAI5489350.1 hypothetical protein TVAGG3_0981810 [Trichomonas vaginalis G3]